MKAVEIVAGRYRLEREAGRGPMGVIFESVEVESGRLVCVKVLERRYTQDPRFAVRFREGYRRITEVAHENLVEVLDYGHQDGRYYVVSEWVEGEDLGVRLKAGGALAAAHAVTIGRQMSAALAAAHAGGVLHRGLKPRNVLLERGGRVKVTDLGLAGVVGETGLSKTSVLSSGAGYMAPEQAHAEPAGPETDVYSAGVLLYEMLTGRRPFEGSGSWTLLRRQVEEIPLEPSRVNREVPFDIGAVAMIALRKERATRYGSGKELEEALEGCEIEAGEVPHASAGRGRGIGSVRPWRALRRTARRIRLPSGLLIALLFLFAFLVTFGSLSTIVDAGEEGRPEPGSELLQQSSPVQPLAAKEAGSKRRPVETPSSTPEIQPASFGQRMKLEGTVQSISSGLWMIAGQQVRVTSATEVKGVILVGDYVKVEGHTQTDGTILAEKIERKGAGQMIKFRGEVEAIQGTTWIIAGRQVVVTSETKLKGSIEVGDLVNVNARQLANGTLAAEEIERHH